MLGIRRIGAGRVDYYLSDVGAEVPVPALGGGRWVGAAAAGLGLGSDGGAGVEPAAFRALLSGRHPGTGLPLPTGPAGGARRVAGFDLTFSAPKSASVVFALGGEDVARAVVAAHVEAVGGALRYLEEHGLGAVRWRGEGEAREVIATSGFAGAMFTHGVNRNLDPHLHSHVVVVNAVHGADGRWSACDGRGLDAHRRAAGGVYEAQLRHALTSALGVRWQARLPGRSPEIAGVSPAVLGEFSSRGADVRRHADAMGVRSAASRQVAWAVTRPTKVTGTPWGELAGEWRRRAGFVGTSQLELDGRGRGPTRARTPSYDEHRFAGSIALTPHGGAHRRDVVAAFATSALEGVPAASLDRGTELWAPDRGVGVAEGLMTRGSVVPATHHLRALGPRPMDVHGHETWVRTARAIDAYRERWGLQRASQPLGVDRDRPLSSLPTSRLADHLRVARQLDAARMSLGRRAPVELDLEIGR